MSQLDFLLLDEAAKEEPASVESLVELPCPVPMPGFRCETCGAWPIAGLARRERTVLCAHHHPSTQVSDFVTYWQVPKLEWRGDHWAEVQSFSESGSGNYRWRERHAWLAPAKAVNQ